MSARLGSKDRPVGRRSLAALVLCAALGGIPALGQEAEPSAEEPQQQERVIRQNPSSSGEGANNGAAQPDDSQSPAPALIVEDTVGTPAANNESTDAQGKTKIVPMSARKKICWRNSPWQALALLKPS